MRCSNGNRVRLRRFTAEHEYYGWLQDTAWPELHPKSRRGSQTHERRTRGPGQMVVVMVVVMEAEVTWQKKKNQSVGLHNRPCHSTPSRFCRMQVIGLAKQLQTSITGKLTQKCHQKSRIYTIFGGIFASIYTHRIVQTLQQNPSKRSDFSRVSTSIFHNMVFQRQFYVRFFTPAVEKLCAQSLREFS